MSRTALGAVVVVVMALVSSGPRAQAANAAQPAPAPIGRAAALRLGAENGPGVMRAGAPRSAAREARAAAGQLTRAPVLTLLGGYRQGQADRGAELGLTVSQEVPLRAVGARRAELAEAWGTFVTEDVRRARLDGATRAALAWVNGLEAAEILKLRRAAEEQARVVVRTSEARFRSGAGMPFDVALARADSAVAHSAVLDAEGAQVEALAELRFSLGLPTTAAVEAQGDLFASEDGEANVSPAAALANDPTLGVAQARAQVSRRETALTYAALGPTFTVGASFLREGGGNAIVTGFVGLPLPVVAPAAFDTARQRGLEHAADAEVAQARAEAAKALSLAKHEREHWRDVRAALRGSALQAAHDALRLALAGYEAGTHDVSAVVLARQRVIATEEQLAHVAGAIQRADIRFARLTGTLLKGPTP
jgi:cobalt-zinc-cadmium efflux system outer membrane protein